MTMKCDMARSMPGHFQHPEFEPEFRQADRFAFAKYPALPVDAAVMGAVNFCATHFLQAPHAANMIGMMVGDQDVCQVEATLIQHIEHRLRITGVNNGTGSSPCGDQPDIIV